MSGHGFFRGSIAVQIDKSDLNYETSHSLDGTRLDNFKENIIVHNDI